MEQKFYQIVILYTKKVLLSKFDDNWRRNEDFMKNAKIWLLGEAPLHSVLKGMGRHPCTFSGAKNAYLLFLCISSLQLQILGILLWINIGETISNYKIPIFGSFAAQIEPKRAL